ncbi:MAG: hypothetical protein HZA74_12815 [Ignavibacteriales bacterium]|jgi:hypothetical protein|nr:hypothetical protein [Ignavibacteriales bacterium]
MSDKKHIHKKEEALQKEIQFCTECGEDLSEFGLNSNIDRKKIEERHKKCKATGKFKGDVCAMIFISDDSEPLPLSDELD